MELGVADEYVRLKNLMEQRALEYSNAHKKAFEKWDEGEIKKIWIDSEGNVCIEYESGNWWHYNDKGEWW
jgi:hypothetical protein